MRNIIGVEYPPELLIGMHSNTEPFAVHIKHEAAYEFKRITDTVVV